MYVCVCVCVVQLDRQLLGARAEKQMIKGDSGYSRPLEVTGESSIPWVELTVQTLSLSQKGSSGPRREPVLDMLLLQELEIAVRFLGENLLNR